MTIDTDHKGYKILFNHETDMWRCPDLEIGENPKLSAIKKRIDEMSKGERRLNVPALMIGSTHRSDEPTIVRVTVALICEPERGYRDEQATIKKCWVVGKHGRTKTELRYIFPVEAETDIKSWMVLKKAADDAEKAAEDAQEALPRHDADSLMLASKEAEEAEPPRARRAARS